MSLNTVHIFSSCISLTMPDDVPLDTLNISTSNKKSFASILSKYCIDELLDRNID